MYQNFFQDDGLGEVSLEPPSQDLLEKMQSDPEPPAPDFSSHPMSKEEVKKQNRANRLKMEEPAHISWQKKMGKSDAARLQIPDSLGNDIHIQYRWALFSYIDSKHYKTISHGDQRYKGRILKISGVFQYKEDARNWASILLKQNPHFMIHLVPFFKWTPVDDLCELTSTTRDNAITTIVLQEYVRMQEDMKAQMQHRLESSVLTKEFQEKIQMDPFAYPTHKPRPDRTAESCRFFAKVEHEKNHPELFALKPPSNDAVVTSFDDALHEENIAMMREKGVVLSLKNDSPHDSIPEEVIDAYRFVVISYLQPEDYAVNKQNIVLKYREQGDAHETQVDFSGLLVRPRGAFKTMESAGQYAKFLVQDEKIVDVHVVENFCWSPMDNHTEDKREYEDEQIKSLIDGYHAQQKELHSSMSVRMKNACLIQAPMFEVDTESGEMKPKPVESKKIKDFSTHAQM